MVKMLEDSIDKIRTSDEDITLILVGGGAVLIPSNV